MSPIACLLALMTHSMQAQILNHTSRAELLGGGMTTTDGSLVMRRVGKPRKSVQLVREASSGHGSQTSLVGRISTETEAALGVTPHMMIILLSVGGFMLLAANAILISWLMQVVFNPIKMHTPSVSLWSTLTDAEFQKRFAVLSAFVLIGVAIKLTQHGAKNLHYNFLCPIMLISTAKLFCSLALYARYDGELAKIPERLREDWTVVMRYSIVAGLFCVYDVLSFVVLGKIDPSTYLTLLQLRTVITGFVWEIAFKKVLSWTQRSGLVLICLACMAKQTKGGFDLGAAANVSRFDYMLLAVQIIANCLAGVANEVLLKEKGSAPLNLQNSVQYFWTICLCLFVGLFCPIEGIHLNPFDLREWSKMLSARMIPNIVILTVLGLVTSVVLKLLNSVWKAVATSVELFMTSYASALVFDYPVHLCDAIALCIGSLGIGLYAHSTVSATPAEKLAPHDEHKGL